ncbi:MAG: carboxypeptidase regulatory-like domain-containing protein, partial [Gammaproteobacteria bacterium]|nr:carboxypeptidase regulatory-like domain-containing protein [Gammaproteobacteria bacterium]
YGDKDYRIWSGVKRKSEENSESRGKPLVIECELSSEEQMVIINNSPIFSLCTWDVEPDEQERIF